MFSNPNAEMVQYAEQISEQATNKLVKAYVADIEKMTKGNKLSYSKVAEIEKRTNKFVMEIRSLNYNLRCAKELYSMGDEVAVKKEEAKE